MKADKSLRKKYRCLHLTGSLERGGKERQIALITRFGNRPDLDNFVLVFRQGASGYETEYDIEDRIIGINEKTWLRKAQALRRLVIERAINVAVAWGNSEMMIAAIALSGLPVRLINASVQHGVLRPGCAPLLRLIVLHLSWEIMANSRAGLKANRLSRGHVLYNGVEERFFPRPQKKPEVTERNRMRRRLFGEHDQDYTFIMVASLLPVKNHRLAIQVVTHILKEGGSVNLIIAGQGLCLDELQKQVAAAGAQSRIAFIGQIAEPEKWYHAADCYLQTSWAEGVSNSLLEAAFCGLPVIASDVGGTSEAVYGPASRLFNPRCPEELTCLMREAPTAFSNMDTQSENYLAYRRRFSIQTMTGRFYRIICDKSAACAGEN